MVDQQLTLRLCALGTGTGEPRNPSTLTQVNAKHTNIIKEEARLGATRKRCD